MARRTRDREVAGDRRSSVSGLFSSLGKAYEERHPAASWALAALLLIAAFVLADKLLPIGIPLGIVVVGLVFGALYALVAVGLVMIFRANRVVNFAQAELGAVAAVVAIQLVREWNWNYFPAVAGGLAMAALLGAMIDAGIIRRFRNAPRLILAVATIGIAQILNGASILIAILFSSGASAGGFETPFRARFEIAPATLSGNHIMAIVAVPIVLIGLVAFFRWTSYGIAIRAAADNNDRASLLGIPTGRLSTMVWAIAGVLSALAIILRIPIVGFISFTSVTGGGNALLLRTLAAAVIGRMENMPLTAAAALLLGVVETTFLFNYGHATYTDVFLVILILVALLTRRGRFSRAEETGLATGTWQAIREVRPIPKELVNLPEVQTGLTVLKLGIAGFALSFPLWAPPRFQHAATVTLIYALVAVSLVVLTGWAGQISLGQFALAGLGGGTVAYLFGRQGWDVFLAIPAGVLVAAIVALLVGLPALRIRGPFLAVTTLAFAVVASSFFLQNQHFPQFIVQSIERPLLWGRISIVEESSFYYLALGALTLVVIGVRRLRNSRTGRALIAIRDNEPAAQSVSINATKLKLTAFLVAGAIAGLAGALFVLHEMGLKDGSYPASLSIRLFSMVVIGGLGSIPGAILGAVYIRGAEVLLPSGWQFVASGAGILLLLLIVPGGVGEIIYRIRDGLLRRVAKRRELVVPSLIADVRTTEEAPVPLGEALAGLSAGGDGRRSSLDVETMERK